MSNLDIIRSWKDEDYRNSLSAEQLASMSESPVGLAELTEEELRDVAGGLFASTKNLNRTRCYDQYHSYNNQCPKS